MINKCLFPAAGYGTRFLPATKAVPKEMLPILTKPLLQYGVEEAMSAGINNMAIVTGRGKRSIEDHFDNSYEIEAQLTLASKQHYLKDIKKIIDTTTFTYVRQKEMLGLGHAILSGRPLIGDEPFAVILADDLCDNINYGVTAQMIEAYKKYECSIIAIEKVPMNRVEKYGIIAGSLIGNSQNHFLVNDMVEKPDQKNSPSNLGIIGRYILTPDIFDILETLKPGKNGEVQITDALLIQAKKKKVIACMFEGTRFDCGTVNGYIKAINHFASKNGILED
jgi:UTP--glucose-1-phosphate uridylyltransferase